MTEPKFCPEGCGETLKVLHNHISGNEVTHVCKCNQCGITFAVGQSIKQWKDE